MKKITVSLIACLLLIVFLFDKAEGHVYSVLRSIVYHDVGTYANTTRAGILNEAVKDVEDNAVSCTTAFALIPVKAETINLPQALTIDENIVIDTHMADTIVVDGDVVIDGNATLTISANVVLKLGGGSSLILGNGAKINGEGELLLSNNQIFLGDPDNSVSSGPNVATIENLTIDVQEGLVEVIDQGPDNDADKSDLFITNQLKVLNGVFDVDDNNLRIVGPTTESGGVAIEAGALIGGEGTFFISLDPAALGGPANIRTDAFRISGEGSLNMTFDKNTDAGVLMELNQIGAGDVSFNRAGALYITNATTFIGTFRAESSSRTEFDMLNLITSNLEIEGPGGEVFPANGICGDGNESGVYFFSPTLVGGEVILVNTNDPALPCGIQGLSFMADNLSESGASTFKGSFTSKGSTGLTLSSLNNLAHNLALEGDAFFGESPAFILESVGTDCNCQNKVIFTGDNNQLLKYSNVLHIEAVEIVKGKSDIKVEIDAGSEIFQIENWLNLVRGQFITNGLLDARGPTNGSLNSVIGNCVTVNSDDAGIGKLDKGIAQSAYFKDGQDFTPRKIKYIGTQNIVSGDEIPGPISGSTNLELDEFEVSLSSPELVLSLKKNLNISGLLMLSSGDLELNSQEINLGKTGVLSESPGNTVKGEQGAIMGEEDLNAVKNNNIGSLGAAITSDQNLGPTTVVRRHAAQTIDGRSSIKRYYDITPTNNADLNATLEFHYDDSELGEMDENKLQLYRSTDAGATWSEQGGSVDIEENVVSLSGIPALSRWTLAEIPNRPPDKPVIISPPDETTLVIEGDTEDPFTVDWEKANDPDGDVVTYTWQFDVTKDFISPLIMQETDTVTAYLTNLGSLETLLTDQGVALNESFIFVHRVIASDGLLETAGETAKITLTRGALVTAIEQSNSMPEQFILEQNYPNPFDGSTQIKYALPTSEKVQIAIFDVFGRKVVTLVNEYQSAGWHIARWEAGLATKGIYFYRLSAGTFLAKGSMILIK